MKLSVISLLALLFGACSPGDEDPPPPAGDTRTGGDAIGGGDETDFRPDTCPIDSFITQVTGTVTDESGTGLENTRAQLCVRVSSTDELKCIYPATADAAGDFVINVPADARCMRQAVMRLLLPASDRGTGYCTIELPTDRATVAIAEPFILYETTRATTLPTAAADQERTVIFGDGLEIDVVPERYFGSGDGYDGLAARWLAPDAAALCLPPALTFEFLYAFSPEGNITGAPFPITMPNTTGLTADAELELFLLGGLACTLADASHVAEGDWVKVGEATVSSDELTIEGGSIPCLNWLGVALK